jgi:hypothetical protein
VVIEIDSREVVADIVVEPVRGFAGVHLVEVFPRRDAGGITPAGHGVPHELPGVVGGASILGTIDLG